MAVLWIEYLLIVISAMETILWQGYPYWLFRRVIFGRRTKTRRLIFKGFLFRRFFFFLTSPWGFPGNNGHQNFFQPNHFYRTSLKTKASENRASNYHFFLQNNFLLWKNKIGRIKSISTRRIVGLFYLIFIPDLNFVEILGCVKLDSHFTKVMVI